MIRRLLSALLLASSSLFAQYAAVSATLTDPSGSFAPAAYLHFSLRNCGANYPVVSGNSFTPVKVSFDLKPNPVTGVVTGQVVGNDQILCGNVASTFYEVALMKDAFTPLTPLENFVINAGSSWTPASMPMSNPPGTPGFQYIFGNPTGSQTITQPLGGSGGTATATETAGSLSSCTATGGTGYQTPPALQLTGGGGSGGIIIASVLNGALNGCTVLIAGSSYTSNPSVAVVGGTSLIIKGVFDLSQATVIYPLYVPGNAAGNPGYVQFNLAGGFGANAAFTFNTGSATLFSTNVTASGTVTAGTLNTTNGTVSGSLGANSIESIKYADQGTGSDCGAKINFQSAALGGAGEIWVNNACGLTSSTAVIIAANQILRFIQPGTYVFPSITGAAGGGVYGDGAGVILKAVSSAAAVNFLAETGGTAPSTVLLNSNSNEGSNVIVLVPGGVATLGFVPGDIYQLQDAASPVHQQVGRILSISSDTLTTDDPNGYSFTTANSAFIYKIVNPVKGFVVSNLTVDASLLSNTGSAALELPFCFACRIENVTVLNSGNGTALLEPTGYQNLIQGLNVQSSGGSIQAAVTINQQGRIQASNIQINHTNVSAFGLLLGNDVLSEFTNVSIGAQETGGGGRGFKLLTAAYNVFNNLESDNTIGGFNGIDVTLGSSHNRFVNCVALNNSTNGIITFGDGGGNQFNTFVNCTSKFNIGNAFTNGASDNNTEVIGGEYGDGRGAATVFSVSATSFTLMGARVWDDNGLATAGIAFGATGAASENLIGNNFSGLPSNTDIDLAGSNVSNSNFAHNQTPDGNTHNTANTNNWIGNIGDGPSITSGVGVPSGNCTDGTLYLNSTPADASHVAYVCKGNAWTAVTIP